MVESFFFEYDKTNYETFLDDPKNKLGVFFSKFINYLLLVFLLVVILESLSIERFTILNERFFFCFDIFVSICFGIEYFFRLFSSKNKFSFIKEPGRIIDFLSFAPSFLGLIVVGDLSKVLRLLRILRVLRLLRKIPLTNSFIKSIKNYLDEYSAVFLLSFIVLFILSFFVYYFEKDLDGTKFTSIPMTLWWAVVTMTTVGYGDMYPISIGGKIFGAILVFLGPILIALISAVTIMVFMETSKIYNSVSIGKRKVICGRCSYANTKKSNYCIKCGYRIAGENELN